ncbi:DUF1294 domain-containing protein, partial [Bacillus subtilis]|uniref:DUF1294 domain-containing protein n=1 Tax=Bacillus subtilis TaxID=1423 RepID=UPI003F4D0902
LLSPFSLIPIHKPKPHHHNSTISQHPLSLIPILFPPLRLSLPIQTFTHKTKHPSFNYPLPLLLLIQAILIPIYYTPFHL